MNLTSILDLLGLLFIVLAVALAVGLFFIPAGFAVGGFGLLGVSWFIDARTHAARRDKS